MHFLRSACIAVSVTGLLTVGGLYADDAETKSAVALKIENIRELPRLAHALVMTFMTENQWKEQVANIRKRCERWQDEHEEDAGRFLNDRLTGIVAAASSGRLARLKEGAIWIAMYGEFEQPLPALVIDFAEKNRSSLNRLLAKFTWDDACAYVRGRKWRKEEHE
jgi:hypothetical protein